MKVYGNLERAGLEALSSNPSAGTLGRFWWNTTDGKAYLDKSANNRPFLLNDDKAILGNSGTASENIRFHRGAAGVIQFLSGADTTAEGTLSTALNQLSARVENYTDAGKPAFGNAGRIIYITDQQKTLLDTGSAWKQVGGGALVITGSNGTPESIVAGTGIAFVALSGPRQMWFVQGSGGHVDITANPQVSAGSDVGQELVIVGRNDDQTLQFDDGNGLSLNGSAVLGANSVLNLVWNGSLWLETSRVRC